MSFIAHDSEMSRQSGSKDEQEPTSQHAASAASSITVDFNTHGKRTHDSGGEDTRGGQSAATMEQKGAAASFQEEKKQHGEVAFSGPTNLSKKKAVSIKSSIYNVTHSDVPTSDTETSDTEDEDSEQETDDEEYNDGEDMHLSPPEEIRLFMRRVLMSVPYTCLLMLFVLFSVFGLDIVIITSGEEADRTYEVLASVCFFFFLIDVAIAAWTRSYISNDAKESKRHLFCCNVRGYLFSFFFWLDLLTSLSMIFDIPWIWNAVTGNADSVHSESIAEARAGRLARVGTRVGRIMRMMQVLKLGKFYSLPVSTKYSVGAMEEMRKRQIGSRLTDLTIRRVIVLILVMLIALSLLFPREVDKSDRNAVKLLHEFNRNRPEGWESLIDITKTKLRDWNWAGDASHFDQRRLVFLEIEPADPFDSSIRVDIPSVYNTLRDDFFAEELRQVRFSDAGVLNSSETTFVTEGWFNRRPIIVEASIFNIGLSVFILLLTVFGSLLFSVDAHRLVSSPIENMVQMAYQASQDPTKEPPVFPHSRMYETKVLQNTVRKIGSLLRLGFGDDGAKIVQRHLVEFGPGSNRLVSHSQGEAAKQERVMQAMRRSFKHAPTKAHAGSPFLTFGHFNPDVPSDRLEVVFVRIRISNIKQIRMALGNRTPLLLNQVSSLVHDIVLAWGGAIVENVHDGWHCVWPIRVDHSEQSSVFVNASMSQPGQTNLESLFSSGGSVATYRRKRSDRRKGDPLAAAGAASQLDHASSSRPPDRKGSRSYSFFEKIKVLCGLGSSSGTQVPYENVLEDGHPADTVDRALLAVLKICAEVNRSKELHDSTEAIAFRKWIKQHFMAEPSDIIRIQCSLHGGWANEVAVGSSRKADVVYFSPHFFAAEYISRLDNEYGSSVILSEAVHSALSDEAQEFCRWVDCRELPLSDHLGQSSERVISSLFIYDTWSWMQRAYKLSKQLLPFGKFLRFHVDPDALNKRKSHTYSAWNRISVLGAADVVTHPVVRQKYSRELYLMDKDLIALRAPWDRMSGLVFVLVSASHASASVVAGSDLIDLHRQGVRHYVRGEWDKAKELLEKATSLGPLPYIGGDAAANAILAIIQRYGDQPPSWWQGFRPLQS
eukprot:gb/GECG01007305.1/.p1 GENE.gb/GECG01007305.1/~~gb/GECG01007305.1/.p1  ORF type:complete len:1112 (+),score=118.33 gb/GECG01007305.1/:1-3336(+)